MSLSRTGIVTLHKALNFGAVLQAYALQRTVNEISTPASIVDYGPSVPDYLNYIHGPPVKKAPKLALYWLHSKEWKTRAQRFDSFTKSYLELTESFRSYSSLCKASLDLNHLVCGSDQIWNPRLPFDPVYFLQFGDSDVSRIAYAPSFGVDRMPPAQSAQLSKLLSSFQWLSCRELSGVRIIEAATGRKAFHTVDPTLLVTANHWRTMAQKAVPIILPKSYILVYSLQDADHLVAAVEKVRRYTGLPVVALSSDLRRPRYTYDSIIRAGGPLEFLSLISQARHIVTNSLHGTIFSLIFEKAASFPVNTASSLRSSDLWQRLSISPDCAHFPVRETFLEEDYSKISPRIREMASESHAFLRVALTQT